MIKIYTNECNTSNTEINELGQLAKSPRGCVINSLLNFSKSLEVLTLSENLNKEDKMIEVVLN